MNDDEMLGCLGLLLVGLAIIAVIALPIMLVSCDSQPKPVTTEVTKLEQIQGKWEILQIIGPDGKAFEATNLVMDIKDNVAFQNGMQLRLEFNADQTALKLFAKTDSGEKLMGEVTVTITNDAPIQMLWADKANPSQETLYQKVE